VHRCDVSAADANNPFTSSHSLTTPTECPSTQVESPSFNRTRADALPLPFHRLAPRQATRPATSPPSCPPNPVSSPSSDPPPASQHSRRCSQRDNVGTSSPAERILPIPIRSIQSLQRLRGCEWAEHPVAPFLRRSAVWIPVFSRADRGRSLLDPSCSGSGIVNRLDYLLEDGA
jgi:hypothetical protein